MRFGLLGTGDWARRTHAPSLCRHPEVQLVGVWGRNRPRTEELARSCGAHAYDSPAALFAAVDAVAIALPPDVQADLAVAAAEAGCHLLLDKPLALSVTAGRSVVGAVARAGVASVVFFTPRFAVQAADWLRDAVDTGGWQGMHATFCSAIYGPGSRYNDSTWRRERGALWDVGPHVLSVALPLMGPVRRLTAVRGPGDTAHLVLEHTGGATTTATVSLTVPPAAASVEITAYGMGGVTRMPALVEVPEASYGRAVDALLGSARSHVPHPCDVRFGAAVVAVLEAAERRLTGRDDAKSI